MSRLKVETWKWILLFFWLAWPGAGGAQTSPYQTGVDFIWLREGVSGGIAARPLTGEILIVRPAGSQARVYSTRKRKDGSYEFSVGTPTGLQFFSEKYQWFYTPSVGCCPPIPGSAASSTANRTYRKAIELICKANLDSIPSCAADFEQARASLYAKSPGQH